MPRKAVDFVSRAIEKHGDRYDYSKSVYTKMHEKVCIICPEHGEFWQEAHSHLKGQGCPRCGVASRASKRVLTTDGFVSKAVSVHGDAYDYSKADYVGSQDKVCIICPEHGEFWQTPNAHLNGRGCPRCKFEKLSSIARDTDDSFIAKARLLYGDTYDYSKVRYVNSDTRVSVICPTHGEFSVRPSGFLLGRGCPSCSFERRYCLKYDNESFIAAADRVHGGKYDYSNVKYEGIRSKVCIVCPKHGEFWQKPAYHLQGNGCPKCGVVGSSFEDDVFAFVSGLGVDAVMHDRSVLGNSEIDIYIPELSIGIECDGLRWHCEKYRDDRYHLRKTERCLERGIRLIHIFEDEWLYKREIVNGRLMNALGANTRKIYGRKCRVSEVPQSECRKFIDENHIQGYVGSAYGYGLYFEDELVSVMTFGKRRRNLGSKSSVEGEYELLRFCSRIGTTVVGGAGKLFKAFVTEMNPSMIISYCDRRWGEGGLYSELGFTFVHNSQPSYFYVVNDRRKNRFQYRKDVLVKEGFDPNKTERQIMAERKIYRIYDCGCGVWKWKRS